MTTLRMLLSRLRGAVGPGRFDAELDEEVRVHIDLLADEHERKGMSPKQARLAARRAFGGVEPMKEAYRDRRGLPWMADLGRDLRYATRTLTRSPGLAAVAVVTLALGIGANAALFSVINALMLRPLPVESPDELRLFVIERAGTPDFTFSHPVYESLRAGADAFSGLIAYGGVGRMRLSAGGGSQAEATRVQGVSGNFFSVLGVRAAVGRVLDPADDRPDEPVAAAVLSDGFWARRFGRDPGVVGRRITVNDVPFTIVGVAQAGFSGMEVGAQPDLWWPIRAWPRLFGAPATALADRGFESWRIVGRLRRGADHARAQAQADAIVKADLTARLPDPGVARAPSEREARARQTLRLESAAAGWTRLRWQFERPLLVLFGVVALVLLIACANVANLLLARAAARRREIAVRMALGCGRGRLVRQLLTESLLLAGTGGLLGLAVAFMLGRLVAAFMEGQDILLPVGLDARVLGFTAVVSFASALLFGLLPALGATRIGFAPMSSDHADATGRGGRLTISDAIVVSQVALSVVVLVAAGLFLRTLTNLQRVDTGYDLENLTVFSLDLPRNYDAARRAALYGRAVETLETSSGARAGFSFFGFLSGNGLRDKVVIPGDGPPGVDPIAFGSIVSPGFFAATGTRITLGRGFEPRDAGSPVHVAVVNQAMARLFGENPLGRRFTVPGIFPGESFEVVGVAADSTYRNLRVESLDAVAAFYLPFDQSPGASFGARLGNVRFALRMPAGAPGADAMIRRALREADPAAVVTEVQSMRVVIDRALVQERMLAQLASWFGVLAFTLGLIGIYGVRSYAVTRRTTEMGIRMALGADAGTIVGLVVRQGLFVALVGTAIGITAAAGLTRFIEGILFRVAPLDTATFAAVTALFAGTAILASYVPARRAARIDPAVTLRSE